MREQKNLIFIDNDSIKDATKQIERHIGQILPLDVEVSQIIPDFYKIDKETIFPIVFDKNNVIITWSVYTKYLDTHSGLQLLSVLRTAGRSGIQDVTYVDMSGMLLDYLKTVLWDSSLKDVVNILKAINQNNIITRVGRNFHQIFIDLLKDDIVCSQEYVGNIFYKSLV